MIEIKIDGEPLASIIGLQRAEIDQLRNEKVIMQKEIVSQQEQLDKQKDDLVNLQNQIIDMQNEGTKERNSFWDFLKGNKKPKESSRITETTVQLDK